MNLQWDTLDSICNRTRDTFDRQVDLQKPRHKYVAVYTVMKSVSCVYAKHIDFSVMLWNYCFFFSKFRCAPDRKWFEIMSLLPSSYWQWDPGEFTAEWGMKLFGVACTSVYFWWCPYWIKLEGAKWKVGAFCSLFTLLFCCICSGNGTDVLQRDSAGLFLNSWKYNSLPGCLWGLMIFIK